MATKQMLMVVGAVLALALLVVAPRLVNTLREEGVDRSRIATPDNPVKSPSGELLLEVHEETPNGIRQWRFSISRLAGADRPVVVFISEEAFRARDQLFILWGDTDRVWVYSGDVGTFFWEMEMDGIWERRSFADTRSIPVPPLLTQLKPGYFDRVR